MTSDNVALPFDDTADFDDARRGFIGRLEPCIVRAADGRVVWDNESYRFLDGPSPATANPSLWRQSQLNTIDGLFEVVPGIYQVRGFDLSNITFVEGDTGVLVIDPLISTETAAAALALYREHRGDRPVVGVIYTPQPRRPLRRGQGRHDAGGRGRRPVRRSSPRTASWSTRSRRTSTPARRWPGARATCTARRSSAARRARSAPGSARRPRPARSRSSRRRTRSCATGETRVVDGIRMEFQITPGTEAPAEMNFLFPDHGALCMAENATHVLHNILTLRGALVRDARVWSRYLTEAIDLFGDRTDVVFASHHWPTWGRERAIRLLERAARPLRLPARPDAADAQPGPERRRDRRGDRAAARARAGVARPRLLRLGEPQREGDLPALHGLVRRQPRAPLAAHAGRAGEALRRRDRAASTPSSRTREPRSRTATCAGRPSCSTSAIFADPGHAGARELQADTSSSSPTGPRTGPWRNFFLAGATELRHGSFGTPASDLPGPAAGPRAGADLRRHRDPRHGPRAWDEALSIGIELTDADEAYRLDLRNGVLVHRRAAVDGTDVVLRLPRAALAGIARRQHGRRGHGGGSGGARAAHGSPRPARPGLRHRDTLTDPRPAERRRRRRSTPG